MNLLYAFHAIMEEKNISKAAVRCSSSQPAMSLQLNQLREILKDDLFFSAAGHMIPTPFSVQIYAEVLNILNSIDRLFNTKSKFDANKFKGKIVIGLSQYSEQIYIKKIIETISKKFPNCQEIDFIRLNTFDADSLSKNNIDIGISLLRDDSTFISSFPLFEDEYAVIGRAGTFPNNYYLTTDDYLQLKHVSIIYELGTPSFLDVALSERKIVRKIKFNVPSFYSAIRVIKNTECIATVTKKQLLSVSNYRDLAVYRIPFELPKIPISIIWHQKNDTNPIMQFLRANLVAYEGNGYNPL